MKLKMRFWGLKFTLLELVIVIGLIGILLALVLPMTGCAGNIYIDKSIHLTGDGNEFIYDRRSDTELRDISQEADAALEVSGVMP